MNGQQKSIISVLSKEEARVLQNVRVNGTGIIKNDAEVNLLTQGMLKVSETTFALHLI